MLFIDTFKNMKQIERAVILRKSYKNPGERINIFQKTFCCDLQKIQTQALFLWLADENILPRIIGHAPIQLVILFMLCSFSI